MLSKNVIYKQLSPKLIIFRNYQIHNNHCHSQCFFKVTSLKDAEKQVKEKRNLELIFGKHLLPIDSCPLITLLLHRECLKKK